MELKLDHFKSLKASGLDSAYVEAMGCYSVPRAEFEKLSPLLAECQSVLAFPYPGVNGFVRYRLYPPQGAMKYWQPSGSPTHLYILPAVKTVLANPGVELWVSEGEKKSAALTRHGLPCIGIGGVWSWTNGNGDLHPEFDSTCFVDRSLVIAFDSNAWRHEKLDIGRALYALGKALESRGAKVEATIIPPADDGSDQGADDFIARNGIGKFKELKRIKLRHDGLAQFKPWWENWRKTKTEENKELLKVARGLQPVEPWPDTVDGAALLDGIRSAISRFIVATDEAIVAETLWVLLAHTIDAFTISPMLVFSSPVRQCGKSVNQAVIGKLSPKPLITSNISPAALFRVVDKYQPTLIVDECDSAFETSPEIRELVNASHLRSQAYVLRTVGDNHDPQLFSTWSAKCLALIGQLPDTTASRSIIVKMQRKARVVKTEKFSALKEYPELLALHRKAARWASDNLPALRQVDHVELPDLGDRDSDNWTPLVAIADLAGGAWPTLARDAAAKLCGEPIEEPRTVELLKDIKAIFDGDPENDSDDGCLRISSSDLAEALNQKEGRPWADYNKGNGITKNQIARLLRGFDIRSPKQMRFAGKNKTLKGYESEWFENAFDRYLTPAPSPSDLETKHQKHDNDSEQLDPIFETKQSYNVSVGESGLTVENLNVVSCVSFQNTGRAELPASLGRFAQIWCMDFEFHCLEGSNPLPHCVVCYEARSGETVRLLRDEFSATPPYGAGADSLVLMYSGASDLRCCLAVGWALPESYIDLATETKLRFNTPDVERGLPSLISSLDRFEIPHIALEDKHREQKRYNKLELSADDRRDILPYCETDVVPLPELFLRLLPDMDIDEALERGRYVVETARIEYRGIPIAVDEYEKIKRNRNQIRLALIEQSPVGPEIYVKGSFSHKKFGEWLEKNEIAGWPTTVNGLFSRVEEDIEKAASEAPILREYRDLYFALKDFKKSPFDVGPDGRSHASQIPYGAITGRNTPGGSVLTASKWWRWLIRAPEGCVLINFDFSAMEYGVAAFSSGDPNMVADYLSGDVHKAVANQLGVSRNAAKTVNFAVQYGGGPARLAQSLGVSFDEGKKLFHHHKSTYSRYWQWSDDRLAALRSGGVCRLDGDGWALRVGDLSDNGNGALTARNFPVQGCAASILRRVVLEASTHGVETVATLHDSLLVQAPKAQAEECETKVRRIMEDVNRQFLGGNAIRVDASVYGDRFEDKDGAEGWERITGVLSKYPD